MFFDPIGRTITGYPPAGITGKNVFLETVAGKTGKKILNLQVGVGRTVNV